MPEQIANYKRYTDLMRNGFYDKLFFVDKLFADWKTLVDYGCADGFLVRMISEIFPDKKIIGYDIDANMIEEAKRKCTDDFKGFFTSSLKDAKGDVLYLSSIIHEIYSYCSADQIAEFWKYVFESGFKYIIIRDMIYTEDIHRQSEVNLVRRVHNWANRTHNEKYLKEFERLHGPIAYYKNLIHFLLKFKYQIGWEREVRENYLPLSIEHLYELIPTNYRIEFAHNYTLPYFKNEWEKEIGIYIDEKIHSKFIIKLI